MYSPHYREPGTCPSLFQVLASGYISEETGNFGIILAKPRLQFPKNCPSPLLPLCLSFLSEHQLPSASFSLLHFSFMIYPQHPEYPATASPVALGLAITSPTALPYSRHPSTESLPNFPWTISLQVIPTHQPLHLRPAALDQSLQRLQPALPWPVTLCYQDKSQSTNCV